MRKIWAVDDDKVYHFVLKRFFQEMGIQHQLRMFSNGSEVIAAAKETQTSNLPDMLLVDLSMPGTSGWDVIETLLEYPPFVSHVSVVIVSSSIDPVDILRSKNINIVKAYLPKPITLEDIADLIKTYGSFSHKQAM